MEKVYKEQFTSLLKVYPQLDNIFKKYKLECSSCKFSDNFTLGEIVDDTGKVKEQLKADLFRFFMNIGGDYE